MYLKENENVSTVILWIRNNKFVWDLLCGDCWEDFTVGDCIDILEELISEEMYQLALILICKLDNIRCMDEAISNVIVNRIKDPNPNIGIITECISEFRTIANRKNIMEEKLELNL